MIVKCRQGAKPGKEVKYEVILYDITNNDVIKNYRANIK
jgi:hypothetical protein